MDDDVKTNMLRLPAKLVSVVAEYISAKGSQAAAESVARGHKKVAENCRAQVFGAMGMEHVALCGRSVLTRKVGRVLPATLTLATGQVVGLADLKLIVLKDGTKLGPEDVAKVFGGRTDSDSLEVA